ncbi:MAG: hypothetical protein GY820_12185 [Gammaproteobacteria bacterium]|nr:hypothetical protein [Gammaproteobacteria bacterium]
MKIFIKLIVISLLVGSGSVQAGEVRIVDVSVRCMADCSFSVTLQHADTGWQHYANQWDVLTLDGEILKSRVLYHPHVNEQPFTRSLSGVPVPMDLKQVKIRARDLKHGYSSQEYLVDLPD